MSDEAALSPAPPVTTRPDRAGEPLPDRLAPLFWDHDPARLAWPADRALIITRVLAKGGLEAWRWLRRRVSDAELAAWIRRRRGRGLSRQRLRFWQLVLDLPAAEVDIWIAARAEDPWYDRRHPEEPR